MKIERLKYELLGRREIYGKVKEIHRLSEDVVTFSFREMGTETLECDAFELDEEFYKHNGKAIISCIVCRGKNSDTPFLRTSPLFNRKAITSLIVEFYNKGMSPVGSVKFKDNDPYNLKISNLIYNLNKIEDSIYIPFKDILNLELLYSAKADRKSGYDRYFHKLDDETVLITLHKKVNNTTIQTKIDLDDLDLVKDERLYPTAGNKGGAYYINLSDSKEYKKLHRLIMQYKGELQIDHIDRDPTNNKKSNLRIVTSIENVSNRGMFKNNSTGVTGVSFNAKNNGYEASMIYKGKKISKFFNSKKYGTEKSFEMAVEYRKKLEVEYNVYN